MSLNPKIFIGSSSQSYSIAEVVANNLQVTGDCVLWKDKDIWEPNKSTFDNLIRMAGYFDFGIFVATADDLTESNGQLVIEPRDNVILEMALFLGAMGKDKSFLLVEEGVKLPSDFSGIYMPRFKRDDLASLKTACNQYADKIEEHFRLGHLSLNPTTALAIGYYKNFLSSLVYSIQEADPIELNDTRFEKFKINVVIPKDLKGNIREKAHQFYKRHGLVENSIKTRFRRHPAWFQLDPSKAPLALLYDMPSTLTGIDDAIEMILQKGYLGRTRLQEIIEQRELNNFRRVLQIQIDQSAFAKHSIEIIDEF